MGLGTSPAINSDSLCLQMRWANFALQHVRLKAGAGEAGRPLDCSDAFLQEMSHFVSNLQQFVMDRLLHGAWLEQQQVSTTPQHCTACVQWQERRSLLVCGTSQCGIDPRSKSAALLQLLPFGTGGRFAARPVCVQAITLEAFVVGQWRRMLLFNCASNRIALPPAASALTRVAASVTRATPCCAECRGLGRSGGVLWASVHRKLLPTLTVLRCLQSLEQATSLEEVTAAHSAFLEAAMRQCLLAPDKTWKLIENAVHRILNLVLQFTTLQRALRQKVTYFTSP